MTDARRALEVLAAALGERFGTAFAVEPDTRDGLTLAWTDGPTADQVAEAARVPVLTPEAAEGLAFHRALSERAVALGAIRLAVAPSPPARGLPVPVSPAGIESLWWRTPLPATATPREERLVYGLLYEVHDDHRSNHVTPQQICDGLAHRGIAMLLLRSGAELTPAEVLTARYAAAHGHLAWRHRLVTMPVPALLRAVREDPQAPPECRAAARALEAEATTGTAPA
ncbi:hypothetical protein [Streptomyces roseicoloratus]|uniref:Uncharacterized protein n=1 Tax=Streptomyces roseicoloratus TaxID=2508722 RepID=A0ABY9S462_9ACTN|nr:hypothetical protein [Streptomyces roseicoloratus]WMX48179.1 hypothetical protein RGF97_29960 [Streptomyces roseicoloratus]